MGHTLSNIPPEMPDAIESMESERRRQDDLGGILDCLRESRDDPQNMCRVESSRSGKVGQEVTVHHCNRLGAEDRGRCFAHTNTEANASKSIGNGGEPCQLGLVDSEVRR